MAERSTEVLVCGASIMKDVWEIRLKDHRLKAMLEDERIRRSRLEKINQDWQARIPYDMKTPKRLERKVKQAEDSNLHINNVKKQMNPRKPERFQGSHLNKQADSTKTTKVNKLDLLRHLNESCPSLMVWAKSWKFSQPLPQPEESSETCRVSDWGKSWKFFNVQPNTDGKPWFDDTNINMTTNGILLLWERLGNALDSQHLHHDTPDPEWEKSWLFTQKKEDYDEGTTNGPNNDSCIHYNKIHKLWDSQHQEDSDWHNSWKSTKPSAEVENKSDLIHPIANEEDQKNGEGQPELHWNTSWMYFKKQLNTKYKRLNHSKWSPSWLISKTIAEQEKKSICPQAEVPDEPPLFNLTINPSTMKQTILKKADICLPKWEKSWVTIKNQSEYKEETNKAECSEKSPTKVVVTIETPQTDCQHIKFDVLALPNQVKSTCHKICNSLRQNESDWKYSWRILKHHHKKALRNQKLGTTLQTSLTEWTTSWKFTNLTLNQDSGLWQKGWSTNTQPRPNKSVREPDEISFNGPILESWRSTRYQYHLERQGASGSTQQINPLILMRSVADWEQSWKSSSSSSIWHLYDGPSMTEWMGSWRFSGDQFRDLQLINTWFEKSMEIKAIKALYRASYICSRSFDFSFELWKDSCRVRKRSDGTGSLNLIKKEVLDWDNSWIFTSYQGDYYLNFKLSTDVQPRTHSMQRSVQIEMKSEWGRSWKISNPQPPNNIALWVDAKPKSICPQDLLLWMKDKQNNYLTTTIHKDPSKLKIWRTSWRFDSPANDFLIMNNTTEIRKHMHTNIDKHKPQEKRWSDACKIAKTQTQTMRHKSVKNKFEEMFAEWIESWRFSNGLKSHAKMSGCLTGWKNAWKFLIDPHVPLNGPQHIKGQ